MNDSLLVWPILALCALVLSAAFYFGVLANDELPTPKLTPIAHEDENRIPQWVGEEDPKCSDFKTHRHAQTFYEDNGSLTGLDFVVRALDPDMDGIACEELLEEG